MMARPSADSAELRALLERLREHRITAGEVEQLEKIVLNDSAAMDVYVRYMAMVAGLRGRLGRLPTLSPDDRAAHAISAPLPAGRRAIKYVVAAGLAVLAGLTCFAVLRDRDGGDIGPATARLDHVSGAVVIESRAGQSRTAKTGISIASGETIRTQGGRSLARLALGDGTRILLAGDGVFTYTDRGAIRLTVQQGTLAASVAAQPRDQPMVIATPGARVTVLGTAFSLRATRTRTEVRVTKGSVELTRKQDGKSVVVAEGKRAAADTSPDLAVQDNSPTSGTWSEDFEDGLPPDWQSGKFVSNGLLRGAKGAAGAVRAPGEDVHAIRSPTAWMDGLFTVHADSHLHLTFKMDHPDWINIFFITRTDDPKDPTTFLHKFSGMPFGPGRPGQWWSVSIPIAAFQRLTQQGFERAPVQAGGLVFGISWTAPGQDRGLVIDRVWVTRGGPGKVMFRSAATTNRQTEDSE